MQGLGVHQGVTGRCILVRAPQSFAKQHQGPAPRNPGKSIVVLHRTHFF